MVGPVKHGVYGLNKKTGRKVFIKSLNPKRTPEEKAKLLAELAELQKLIAERESRRNK